MKESTRKIKVYLTYYYNSLNLFLDYLNLFFHDSYLFTLPSRIIEILES